MAAKPYIDPMMMNLAMTNHRPAKPGPTSAAMRDYDSVRRAIAFISENWRNQPEIEAVADAASVTPDELHHLFRRWAGLTPKAFMQALTLDHAQGPVAGFRQRARCGARQRPLRPRPPARSVRDA